MDLTPSRLIMRCYAEKIEDQWQAFCLDLTLGAQADSFEEVKAKLNAMIADYVTDALNGQDKEFAESLLQRHAPFRYWAKWYYYMGLCKIGIVRSEVRRLFKEVLPIAPVPPTAHA